MKLNLFSNLWYICNFTCLPSHVTCAKQWHFSCSREAIAGHNP